MDEITRAREVLAMAEGSREINLSDAKGLAEALGLPEAHVAAQPEYARLVLFEDRLKSDAALLEYAGRDGARAAIASRNFPQMERIRKSFENVGILQSLREEWAKIPADAQRAWRMAGSPPDADTGEARPGLEVQETFIADGQAAADINPDLPPGQAAAEPGINAAVQGQGLSGDGGKPLEIDAELELAGREASENLRVERPGMPEDLQGQELADPFAAAELTDNLPDKTGLADAAIQTQLAAGAQAGAFNPELNMEEIRLPEERAQAPGRYLELDGWQDFVLDPFRNLANGFIEISQNVYGGLRAAAELAGGADSALAEWFSEQWQGLERRKFRTVKAESFGARLAQDVVRNAPQLAVQAGLWFMRPLVSGLFMGGQILGGDYVRHRARGISPANAAFAASIDAALQGALEYVGIGYALGRSGRLFGRMLPGLPQRLLPQLPLAAGKTALLEGAARGAAVEGLTEAAQYMPEYMTGLWAESSLHNEDLADRLDWTWRQASDLYNLQQATKEALYEGLVGAILGAGMGAAHAGLSRRAALRMEERELAEAEGRRAAQVVERLHFGKAMEEARAAAMESAQANDYQGRVEIMAASLPDRARYAWLAPEDMASLVEARPELFNQFAEAIQLPPQALPLFMEGSMAMQADLAPVLAMDGDAGRLVSEMLRLEPDAPSFAEATMWRPDRRLADLFNIFNQEADEDLEGFPEAEQAGEEQRQLRETRSRMSQIHAHIVRLAREMRAQGAAPIEAASAAELIEAHALTMWRSYGLDPLAFLDGFHVEGEGNASAVPGWMDGDGQADSNLVEGSGQPQNAADNAAGASMDGQGEAAPEDAAETAEELQQEDLAENAQDDGGEFSRENRQAEPPEPEIPQNPGQPETDGASAEYVAELNSMSGEDLLAALSGEVSRQAQEPRPDIEEALEEFWNSSNQDGVQEDGGQNGEAGRHPGEHDANSFSDRQGRNLRGQALISESARIIRLFSGRDVSTIPHEAAHVFVDSLLRAARSEGRLALSAFRNELEKRRGGRIVLERLDAHLKQEASMQDAFRALQAELKPLAQTLREERRGLLDRSDKMKQDGSWLDAGGQANPLYTQLEDRAAQIPDELAAILAGIRQAKRALQHIGALSQAREDVKTLAGNAKLSDADLDLVLRELDRPGEQAALKLRALQETAAHGFNTYLKEGKAPSAKLRNVFARLSEWLKRLWKNARHLLSETVAPETAAVFDRMLATQAEMELFGSTERIHSGEADFANLPGMDREDRAKLLDLLSNIRVETVRKLERRKRKERERFRRERVRALMKDLQSDPFWDLAENARFTKEEIIGALGSQAGPELIAAWPRIVGRREESLSEIVDVFRYESASDMFEELHKRLALGHESRRGLAERLADEEVAQMEREDEAELGNLALDSFKDYLDYADLATARLIAKSQLKSQREIERWVDDSRTPHQLIADQAAALLQSMPIRKISAPHFQDMLHRALKKRDRLLESGSAADLIQALNMVTEARIALECLSQVKSQEKANSGFLRKVRDIRARAAGFYEVRCTEALRKLMDAFRLGNMRATEDTAVSGTMNLEALVGEIAGDGGVDGVLPVFSEWLLKLRNPLTGDPCPMNWRDLSPLELQELDSLITWLSRSGREEMSARRDSERNVCQEIAESCAASMSRLKPHERKAAGSFRAGFQNMLEKAFGTIDQLIWQFRKGDGMVNILGRGEPGPLEKILRKGYEAERNVNSWIDRFSEMAAPHLDQFEACRKRLERRYGRNLPLRVNGIEIKPPKSWQDAYQSDHFTVEMVLAMALHFGNSSNLERLLAGYRDGGTPETRGLNYETFSALFGSDLAQQLMENPGHFPDSGGLLTSGDWQAVQGIWDALQILWPDTAATHMRLFGFAPPVVPKRSLKFLAGDGKMVFLKGGYFPVRYDGAISGRVGAWNEQEELFARNLSMFNAPAARRGHTRQRTRQAPGLPVRLDLGMISEHVSDAARFIEFAELVRRADRITQNPLFRRQYEETWGREDFNFIRSNLRGLVRQEKADDIISRIGQKVRPFAVYAGLAWRLNVAAVQLTALFPGMADTSVAGIIKSVAHLSTHGLAAAQAVWKASPYMKSRIGNLDQDLQKKFRQFTRKRKRTLVIGRHRITWDDFVSLGMQMIVAADAMATLPVWLSAYNMKLSELRGKGARPHPESVERQPDSGTGANAGENVEARADS